MDFSFPFSRRQNFGYGFLLLILSLALIGKRILLTQESPNSETLAFSHFPLFAPLYQAPCIEINQATIASWDSLPGIGPSLSQRIVRYRDSRGGFQTIEDLSVIYGLKRETLAKIETQLWLEKPAVLRKQKRNKRKRKYPAKTYYRTAYKSRSTQLAQITDLNQADSTQLDALPGIGPTLARRILKYRQILGYYYHVDQLQAVYGLSEENFERMKPFLTANLPPKAKQISLNTASRWEIKRLAFWEEAQADSLLQARRRLGRFDEWEEVAQLSFIPPRAFEELRVYCYLPSVNGK